MPHTGHVNGTIGIRPVRVGMVLQPVAEAVSSAAQASTCVWGGMHYPWLVPGDPGILRTAEALSIDVLHPVAQDPAAQEISSTEGYRWDPQQGTPFGSPDRLHGPGVLPVEWLLDEPAPNRRLVLPEWNASDPLAPLFEVWFGRYGGYPAAVDLRSRFALVAEAHAIGVNDRVPDLDGLVTPIGLTGLDMEYDSDDCATHIVLVDVKDPADLIAFWTARAVGHRVFPWPVAHSARVFEAAERWLRRALVENALDRSVRGDGLDLGASITVIGRHRRIPEDLAALLQDLSITAVAGRTTAYAFPQRGRHPFMTSSVKEFSLPLVPEQTKLVLPMPRFGPERWRPDRHHAGIVAAHVVIDSVTPGHPDRTPVLPNLRAFSSLLALQSANLPAPFHRPARGGRVFGVVADGVSDHVHHSLLETADLLRALFSGSNWDPQQEPNGRNVAGLIRRLGGIGSSVGCEPAVWGVLHEVSKSVDGMVQSQLEGMAGKHKERWPGPLANSDDHRNYPKNVVLALQRLGLLDPVAPLHCPECRGDIKVQGIRLEPRVACPRCHREFPLGFVLGAAGRRFDWRFQLADGLTKNLMTETRPVMAAVSVLAAYHRELFPRSMLPASSGTTMSCHLGVRFHFKPEPREVDLVVILDDGPRPVVVVGEVKGGLNAQHGDLINDDDISLLSEIQAHLRAQGIECFLLVAVMREHLEPGERDVLNKLCAPSLMTTNNTDGFVRPVLPIVLTGPDLKQPQFTDGHPHRWACHGGLAGLALESCRRNLWPWPPAPADASASSPLLSPALGG
ncbi:hypothetical protein [Kitasatospora sp. NPDC002965]|uniref:hypothetical protein n=1 Tax=Kitasatospora sp. NPDC002965 TaxID=3154775 RepID=UPI0033A1AF9A